jgi:hypothetical protein
VSAVALLSEHGGAVEADLLRFYRVDVRELGTPRLTWRRFLALVAGLPRTSATFRAMHPESADWGLLEQLTAAACDALSIANWQRAQAGSKTRIAPPKPIQRPGVTSAGERRWGKPQPLARIRARLDRLNGPRRLARHAGAAEELQ